MSKRPAIDLSALTSEAAAPMPEASQRTAPRPVPQVVPPEAPAPPPVRSRPAAELERTRTENLQALAFKVPPAFRKRFRQRAANADLKLNELLFAALEAWEEKNNL
ncbi:MAG: hypothetical protein ACREFP_09930 [Acetobacteraceae bacterium]